MNTEKNKKGLPVQGLIAVIVAVIAYMAARLLHSHVLRRVDFLRRVPEVSDVIVIGLGAYFGKNYSLPIVIGAGLSLVRNLFKRFDVRIVT